MNRLKELLVKFLKFGVVGFSGMIVDYGFLYLFKEVVGVPALWANVISFTLAATSNYILNRIWTFRSHDKQVGKEFAKFFIVSLIGLGISTLTLYLLLLWRPEWEETWQFYLLKFVAIVITTLWNFFGNLLFTFREKKKCQE